MDNSFEIAGKQFKVGQINAVKQYHIVRRIGPILGEMLPALTEIKKLEKGAGNLSDVEQLDQIAKLVTPIMNGLSKLSDEDAEYVLFGLLAAVEMKQTTGNWAKVVNSGMLMFADLPFPVLVQAAGKSFMHNIADFFDVLRQQ